MAFFGEIDLIIDEGESFGGKGVVEAGFVLNYKLPRGDVGGYFEPKISMPLLVRRVYTIYEEIVVRNFDVFNRTLNVFHKFIMIFRTIFFVNISILLIYISQRLQFSEFFLLLKQTL